LFRFITGKPLWINILFGFLLIFIVLFLFLISLDFFTKHGKTLTIPEITGKSLAEAERILDERGFDIEIQDSIYVDTAAAMTVLKQFPEADAVVKENRTVYLTINRSVPPTIEMPNLISMTFRSAEMSLRQYGLYLEDTFYRPDIAKNAVLEQRYDGEPIKPGTKIQMGSSITLILGSGLGDNEFSVPDLFGMNYYEARTLAESTGLIIVPVIIAPDVQDTASAYVYKQIPERVTIDRRINRIRPGQSIDVFLQYQKPVRIIDTTVRPLLPEPQEEEEE
jgi:beta-lactam-binding protein with PASTA domain